MRLVHIIRLEYRKFPKINNQCLVFCTYDARNVLDINHRFFWVEDFYLEDGGSRLTEAFIIITNFTRRVNPEVEILNLHICK
jgi:hypothetical protein